MARAKNTSRAEARRRTKEFTRSEAAMDADEQSDSDAVTADATARPPRKSNLAMPDIRADLRAFPGMFRAKPILLLPFVLIAVGFVLALVINALPVDMQQWVLLYIQYFFFPQALFTYFIGGFLAPRGSYLVGFVLGLVTGLLWVVVLTAYGAAGFAADIGQDGMDLPTRAAYYLGTSIFLGTVAGGFAGWYRDFLRGMQDRGRQRKTDQEAVAKAKRRDDRTEGRRPAKKSN